MFGLLVACALSLQAPQHAVTASWVDDGVDPSRPNAVTYTGTVELTPAEAFTAAKTRAEELTRQRLRTYGAKAAEEVSPFWLPQFVRNQQIDRWVDRQLRREPPAVLDRDDVIRDHGFGKSFQTKLLVDSPEPSARALRRLSHRIDGAGELFLAKCGGTVVFWGVLALVFWWLDRLSRGYMSGRLFLLAASLGISVPGVAFLFI